MSRKLGLRRLMGLVWVLTAAGSAADDGLVTAVRAGDDERVAATIAGAHARRAAIYSDGLRYVHSNGKIDNQAEQADGLAKRTSVYECFDCQTREFCPAAPGVMLMPARWPAMRRMPRRRTETT